MTKIQVHEAEERIEDRLQVTLTCISEMKGVYPEIALPEDIDKAALGEEAFFVTLPIGQAGARSRNQRTYSRAAVEQMVAQINTQRPEGMWGHLKAEDTSTKYDPPAIRWLAAALDAEGIAWGKGLPLTEQTREYYRLAKATNARVGTSLVAWAQMDGSEVTSMELVAVDLADPARVGVPITAARPGLSKEMGETSQTSPRLTKCKLRLPGSASPLHYVERGEGKGKDSANEERAQHAAPLQEQILTELSEMLGEGDVVERVSELIAEREALVKERAALVAENTLLMDAAITAAVERAVRIPSAVALVEELVRVRAPQTQAEITAAVEDVVEGEAVQAMLRAGLSSVIGPTQRRPVRREGDSGGYFEFGE